MARYPEYKESGTPWIGKIPSHWDVMKIKQLFSIGRGRVIAATELDEDGIYPVYSSQTENNGCMGYLSTYDFDCEQLTWTTDGANAGTVFRREGKHNCTNVCGTLQLPIDSENNLHYLEYALYYVAPYNKRRDTNGYKIMNNEMAKIVIPVPLNDEQNIIAIRLDRRTAEIDSLLADLQSQKEKLDCYKRELIAEVVTKGLDKSVTMKDSGADWIGEIPAHWDITPLRTFLKVVSVKNNADLPLLSVEREKGVVDRETEGSENNHNRIPDDLSNYKVVRTGQFVMNKMKAWRGSYGVSNYDGIVSPAYYVFDLKFPTPTFFNYAIRSTKYIGFFGRDSYGIRTDQWDFKIGAIKDIPLAVPPVREQQAIVEYLDRKVPLIEGLNADITAQIDKLKQYRQIVIHDAVTGKIKVTEG